MDYGQVFLNKLKDIEEAAGNIRAQHYKLELDINELIEKTANLIEEFEELTVNNRALVTPPHGARK